MSPFRRVIHALRVLAEGAGGPGTTVEQETLARILRKERLARWGWSVNERAGDRINTEVELLTDEHESDLLAEHGIEALYNYYVDRG